MVKKLENLLKVTFIIIFLLSLSLPPTSQAALRGTTNNAVLSLSLNTGTYKVGNIFTVDILINTHGQNVVAVSAFFNFDPTLFQVISIDTSASIFTTQWESATSSGGVKISRSIPTPGVNVTAGKVATLSIQGLRDSGVLSADNFHFTFTPGVNADSQVILDDGLGTNILSGVDEGRYTLDGTPPANVTSFTATTGDGQVSLSWTNPVSDFAGVRILRKTGSYPANYNDGTVVYENSGTSYLDTGLTNGTTYYYKAFSRDTVYNYSSGAQTTATPRDATPPTQITTLAATALTFNSIRLNWTAVGDDGNFGTATSYDIRYSTANITTGTWNSATQVSGEPAPRTAGTAETMTITGLSNYTTYYFAIEAVDDGSNASVLSNVVNARTFKTADLNNDGIVNIADAGIMMSYWNNATRPPADINQDGIVNINDAGIMMSQWG